MGALQRRKGGQVEWVAEDEEDCTSLPSTLAAALQRSGGECSPLASHSQELRCFMELRYFMGLPSAVAHSNATDGEGGLTRLLGAPPALAPEEIT